MIKQRDDHIDNSYFSFRRLTGVVEVHLKSSGCIGRVVDASLMTYARKRDSGSDLGLAVSHMEQRSQGWATSFNTLWRGWHINQFSNIICHKWRCIPQPKSWLKVLLAMPISTVFANITRPICQIAKLIHTDRMHQYNWKFWLETCYFQAGLCSETYCDWIDCVDDVKHQISVTVHMCYRIVLFWLQHSGNKTMSTRLKCQLLTLKLFTSTWG